MRVVITGGAGYVGSVLTAYLLAEGMEVTAFDRLVYGGESLLSFISHPRFRFVRGDVRRPSDLLDSFEGADAVVHLAAVVGEAACSVDEAAAWDVNYTGTENALKGAVERRVRRFIFVSTCSNYGISNPEDLADEDFQLRPLSEYARSKVDAEKYVLQRKPDLCGVVLRLGTICGLSPRMRFDLLVSEMARSAALGDPIQIFAPKAWRPFLHISDASRAIAQCLCAPDKIVGGKVFNVVGENCQKQHLVEIALRHYPQTRITVVDKRADLRDYRASADRIRAELAFTPRLTVEDAFLETASAVSAGIFRDPRWRGYSAVPIESTQLRES